MAIRDPVHHRSAQPGQKADNDTDDAAPQDDEFVSQRVLDAVQPSPPQGGGLRNRATLDQQIDDFRKGEQPQTHDHQGNAVHQVIDPEGVAIDRHGGGIAQGAQRQPQTRRQDAPDGPVPRQNPDHRHPQQRQHEKLRRSEGQDDRPGNGNNEHEHGGADQPADQRCREGGPQRSGGFALLGQWIAVHDRGLGGRRARNAHHDGRKGVGGRNHGHHADEQGEGRVHLHSVDHRQKDGHAHDSAQSRQYADAEPQQHAAHEHEQVAGGQQCDQCLEENVHKDLLGRLFG